MHIESVDGCLKNRLKVVNCYTVHVYCKLSDGTTVMTLHHGTGCTIVDSLSLVPQPAVLADGVLSKAELSARLVTIAQIEQSNVS